MLGCLDPCGSAFRKCLRELKTICGDKTILPTSYTLPPHLLEIDPEPVASGGSGDVYKGTFNGSEVCIKRVRVRFQSDQPRAAKVCCRCHCFPCSLSLTKLTDLLPRGCIVETLDTPERLAPSGYHRRPPPARFEMGVRRQSARTHPEISRFRSAWIC